jgi:hypothetical protein
MIGYALDSEIDAPFTATSIETGGLDETRRDDSERGAALPITDDQNCWVSPLGFGRLARLNSLLFLLRTYVRVSHGEKVNSSSS